MIRTSLRVVTVAFLLLGLIPPVRADEPAPTEADYYPLVTLPIPDGAVLEAGALEMMPDGKLAVSTRRGEIYLVANPLSDDPTKPPTFERFA